MKTTLRAPHNAASLVAAVTMAVIIILVPAVTAQTYPALETYISFAMAHSDYGTSRINSPGLQLSAGYNINRFLRLTGEFSGNFHGTDLVWDGREMKLRDYHLLFGPELVFRNRSKVTPYVHVLGGYVMRHYNVGTNIFDCGEFGCTQREWTVIGESGPGLAVGGGLDIAVHRYISLRAVQFDYVRTHATRDQVPWLDPSQMPPLKSWQTTYRFGIGIVFKLGEHSDRRR